MVQLVVSSIKFGVLPNLGVRFFLKMVSIGIVFYPTYHRCSLALQVALPAAT
jgi:hypothetical protein